MEWEDCSSYSRGDKERVPHSWQFKVLDIRICVHRHIHYPNDQWLLSCEPFYNKFELPYSGIEVCRQVAIDMIAIKLRDISEILQDYKETP